MLTQLKSGTGNLHDCDIQRVWVVVTHEDPVALVHAHLLQSVATLLPDVEVKGLRRNHVPATRGQQCRQPWAPHKRPHPDRHLAAHVERTTTTVLVLHQGECTRRVVDVLREWWQRPACTAVSLAEAALVKRRWQAV